MFWLELNQDIWVLFAKFNLFWASVFTVLFSIGAYLTPSSTFFVIENILLAGIFGFLQTYCWLSK